MPFRTDLAVEAAQPHVRDLPAGVTQQEHKVGNMTINRVEIRNQDSAVLIGKPQGLYVTVTTPPLYTAMELGEEEIVAIAEEIAAMLPPEGLVLVVGLGNNDITPDAIGPRAVHQVLATRHITQDVAAQSGLGRLRPAAAVTPGVLGQTGIETSEFVRALVEDIRPVAVIVVDALAAHSASRLGCTVQIADSGISPGSGVMNPRKELSQASLGVPVVSVGIPTVVDATTLAGDLLQGPEEDIDKVRELFQPQGQVMMITPREIDVLIGHACKTLSLAINKALQPGMTLEELGYLVS